LPAISKQGAYITNETLGKIKERWCFAVLPTGYGVQIPLAAKSCEAIEAARLVAPGAVTPAIARMSPEGLQTAVYPSRKSQQKRHCLVGRQ